MKSYVCIGILAILAVGQVGKQIDLPKPTTKGTMSFEEATSKRRATRAFTADPLTLAQVSQIMWAAQGITTTSGPAKRTVPSAMAMYPLTVYVVVGEGKVTDLPAGVYKYVTDGHKLELVRDGDHHADVVAAAMNQNSVQTAPITVVIAADSAKMKERFKERADSFVNIEVGAAGQNIQLESVCLGLASVTAGMFDPAKLREAVGAPDSQVPLYILPIGKAKT